MRTVDPNGMESIGDHGAPWVCRVRRRSPTGPGRGPSRRELPERSGRGPSGRRAGSIIIGVSRCNRDDYGIVLSPWNLS